MFKCSESKYHLYHLYQCKKNYSKSMRQWNVKYRMGKRKSEVNWYRWPDFEGYPFRGDQNKICLPILLDKCKNKELKLHQLLNHHVKLEEIGEAIQLLKQPDCVKVLIRIWMVLPFKNRDQNLVSLICFCFLHILLSSCLFLLLLLAFNNRIGFNTYLIIIF